MKVKPVWYIALLALVNIPILLTFPPLARPIWITQRDLTTEGLGAALMHLRKSIALAQLLNTCVNVPLIKSVHGYYASEFFHRCPSHPSWGPLKCQVRVFQVAGGFRFLMPGRGYVDLDALRLLCHTVEVLNPDLRDYENRYNSTEYLVKNLRRVSKVPLSCNGIDTVFHYRYGDIARKAPQKQSKQVHEDTVRKLIARETIFEQTLLIVTDPSGERHISSKFPTARFFTRNDPAALRACAGNAITFIGGGSTYAYICFQMINPQVVFTSNVNAKSRVRYPRNITIALPN